MRNLLIIVLFISIGASAQVQQEKLISTIRDFHIALVNRNTVSINQQTDKALSYGHSNGWIENKSEVIEHLQTGYIKYNSIKEDSMSISMDENLANARFTADINVDLNGKNMMLHLRVLEVWVKKGKRWLLFARQALR